MATYLLTKWGLKNNNKSSNIYSYYYSLIIIIFILINWIEHCIVYTCHQNLTMLDFMQNFIHENEA